MYNVNSLWYVYVSVGAEKKIMGCRNDILGPGKKRWLTPAMIQDRLYSIFEFISLKSFPKVMEAMC